MSGREFTQVRRRRGLRTGIAALAASVLLVTGCVTAPESPEGGQAPGAGSPGSAASPASPSSTPGQPGTSGPTAPGGSAAGASQPSPGNPGGAAVPLGPETRLALIVSHGQEATLRGHAQWDGRCRSLAAPVITVVEPPAHGRLEIRPADVVASANWFGATRCTGRTMKGMEVHYVSAPGYRGVDRVRYIVDYGAGRKPQPVRIDIGIR